MNILGFWVMGSDKRRPKSSVEFGRNFFLIAVLEGIRCICRDAVFRHKTKHGILWLEFPDIYSQSDNFVSFAKPFVENKENWTYKFSLIFP